MACWERGDCLAIQVVNEESAGSVEWCVLLNVRRDGTQIKGMDCGNNIKLMSLYPVISRRCLSLCLSVLSSMLHARL